MASSAGATPQFPPTFVYQKDGQWKSTEPNGWGLVIETPKGRTHFDIEDIFTDEEIDNCLDMTTAGPEWGEFTLYYFTPVNGKMHYIVRTQWGRRIVFELTTPKLVPAESLGEVLDAAERKRVMTLLKEGAKKYVGGPEVGCCQGMFQVLAAVHVAGETKVAETVPLLKKLETVNYIGSSTLGGLSEEERMKPGDINPFSYREYTLRKAVQTALRRLGEKPAGLPATGFNYLCEKHNDEGTPYLGIGRGYENRAYDTPRSARLGEIRIGMKPVELLDVLGPPDEVYFDEWLYHDDVDEPLTLHVIWDRETVRVARFEKQVPPHWAVRKRPRKSHSTPPQSPTPASKPGANEDP